MNFAQWMRLNGLSESSVDKYSGAIDGRLTNWAKQHGLTSLPISEILDLSTFTTIAEGVKRTPEFQRWNLTGHYMYSAALRNYRDYLQSVADNVNMKPAEFGPHSEQVVEIEADHELPFNPKGQEDARERVLREIVQRRGQLKFRNSLIAAYTGRCAITGCGVIPLLEAAHITPYLGPETHSVTNGLLLRADIHTLWDLGLIAVEPRVQTVWVSPEVVDPSYQSLSGSVLFRPHDPNTRPSVAALEQQWHLAHEKLPVKKFVET